MSCSTSRIAWSGASASQQRHHARRFLGAHAGERLVEQQHLGLGREHHRDLELALLAVATAPPRMSLAARSPARPARARARARRDDRPVAARVGEDAPGVRRARLRGEAAVLERGERREDVGLLDSCGRCRGATRRSALQPRDVAAPVADAARRGGESPDSRLISVDLPAPLGPITAWRSPRCELDGDVVDGGEAAEAARQPGGRRAAPQPSSPPRPRRTRAQVASPPGRNSTSSDDRHAQPELPVLGQRTRTPPARTMNANAPTKPPARRPTPPRITISSTLPD